MKPAIKKRGKKLTDKRLAKLEKQFGVRFPKSYREFMLENNGGSPEPYGVCRKRKKTPSEVCQFFFRVDSGRDFDDWSKTFKEMKDKKEPVLPHRLVPIAADPFGNLFCISVAGKDAGRIYFWHHEECFIPEPSKRVVPDDSGISLMADSFDDFLNQFEEGEEAPAGSDAWESWIEAGDVKRVRQWLDQGGNLKKPSRQGEAPLQVAIEADQYPVVDLFLKRGVDADLALSTAIQLNRWNLARSVVKREKRKWRIDSAMFAEALEGCDDADVIRALLDAGAPVRGEHFGNNPLHSATLFNGNPQIVKLLLDRGAKLEQSSDNRSALANCICNGNLAAARLLLDAGENLYAAPLRKTKKQIRLEREIKDEQRKRKPDQGTLVLLNRLLQHEVAANAPKAAVHYFERPEKAGIPKSFKKDIIEYAATLGQKPPEETAKRGGL